MQKRFRTLFISDIHLGAKSCQAELLLEFLSRHEADTIYLVGDIIDGWRLKKNWYWPQAQNDLVQAMLSRAQNGTRVVFMPGNHDEFARAYLGQRVGGIEIVDHAIHTGPDDKRYLVIHGDQFDAVVTHARWLAKLGDWAYRATQAINARVSLVRRAMGLTYWSFSAWAKFKVKKAVTFISDFETTLAAEARKRDAHGVICGHIHHAAIQDMHGVAYMNCGDWVESCTALAEAEDGSFQIITWSTERLKPQLVTLPAPTASQPRPRVAA
ncbi:MAG: UDP-2,3-diacylglucosamine diphosphatase [Bosea sp. (in: a-proteobacteria)]